MSPQMLHRYARIVPSLLAVTIVRPSGPPKAAPIKGRECPRSSSSRRPVETGPTPALLGPAVRIQRPSELKEAPPSGPKCQRIGGVGGGPPRTSQVRASWSLLAVRRRLPSGEKATEVIAALWPENLRRIRPAPMLQTRIVPLASPVASNSPSLLKPSAVTPAPRRFKVCTGRPRLTIVTRPLLRPRATLRVAGETARLRMGRVATIGPSGPNATAVTGPSTRSDERT